MRTLIWIALLHGAPARAEELALVNVDQGTREAMAVCSDGKQHYLADELDEGRFTWLSPTEIYGTPWSESDPAVCQVVSVERLRRFAREAERKR